MKRNLNAAGALVALVATTILAACGGGSSTSSSGTPAPAMAVQASGVISGFASGAGTTGVLVNGQRFSTGSQTGVLDGDNDDSASATTSLKVGMTVDVDSSGGSATMLRFTSAVRGEVDAVDATGSTLTVLGQKVRVTSGTSFAGNVGNNPASPAPLGLSDIHAGDYVVVFGFLECPAAGCASGSTDVVATLVNEPSSIGKYRVQGYVTNYSASAGTFTINGLTVDIVTTGSSPTQCNTMNCAFANGDFVSVRSTTAPTGTFSSSGSTLTLAADSVKLRPEARTFMAGATVTIEGPVSMLQGTGFVVRGIGVDASGIAASVAGLLNNQIVEVTGTITTGGTLTATAITVERYATFALMGPLDSVSTTGFSVLGQGFTVNASTRFSDQTIEDHPFDSTNFSTVLMAGDQVIVSGYPSGGSNVATRVERIQKPSSPMAAVQGIVSSDNAPTDTMATVAGVSVTFDSGTRLMYYGSGTMPTLSGFFAAITPGKTIIAVRGVPGSTAGTITASGAAVLQPGSNWGD